MPAHSKNNILALFNIHNWQRLPTPPSPPPSNFTKTPLLYWLSPFLPSHFWLASLADRVITSCVNLRHDIFLVTTKKSLSSLSTLVPEAPCCVVYVTRRQGHQRFHTDDEFPYHRHTHHTTLREQKTNSLI